MRALLATVTLLAAATAGAQCKRIADCVCDQAAPLVAVTHVSAQDGGVDTLTIDAWAGTGTGDGGPAGSTFESVMVPGDALGQTVLVPFSGGVAIGLGERVGFADTVTCGTSTFSESQALAAMVSTDCHGTLFPGTTAPNQTCNDTPGRFGCSTGTGGLAWLALLPLVGRRRRT